MTLAYRSGRTTVRVTASTTAPRGIVGCKRQCRRDYPKDRSARVQCYRSCKEFNPLRAFNGGSTGPAGAVLHGPECRPEWPALPPGANLTIDPSRPPPTTAQHPFCDWPSSSCLADVQSYPPVQAVAPPQPRLSNRLLTRARARRAAPSARACDGETCAKCGGTCTWVEDNGKSKMICYDWWTGTSKQTCHNRMRPGVRPRAVRQRNQAPRFATTAREITQLVGRNTR